MDPQAYRDARWHALVRAAEDLGATPEEAPGLVDRVLTRQRRRIRRAEDPDPQVRQALADAMLGPARRPADRSRRRRAAATVALVAALAAVATAIAVTRPAPLPADHLRADQIPSLFGYDADAARALLEDRGLEVSERPFRSCEVLGRVLTSEPAAGTTYERGDRVVLLTAVPSDVACLTDYQDRELAWQLLDFTNGHGPAPAFAERVWVYPGAGQRLVLSRDQAADPATWDATGLAAPVRAASAEVELVTEHPVTYAVPAIRIVPADEGLGRCGVPEPSVAGTADVVAVLVRSADRTGCPLRLEIYRDPAGRVESVALYRTSS